jgi:hypothetical protein
MLRSLVNARIDFVVVGGVAAVAHGATYQTNDLDVCYATQPDNLHRLATLLAQWEAYPRGWESGLPFSLDERTFRTTPLLTLHCAEGDIDLLDRVAGVGDYAAVRDHSVEIEAFDLRFRALDLNGVIAAKRAAGRPKDLLQLPELEALRELRRRG